MRKRDRDRIVKYLDELLGKLRTDVNDQLAGAIWYFENNAEIKAHNFAWASVRNALHLIDKAKTLLYREGRRDYAGSSLSPLWEDNEIQFARLICEMVAAGGVNWPSITEIAKSMDLEIDEITELFERANTVWESFKETVCTGSSKRTSSRKKASKSSSRR